MASPKQKFIITKEDDGSIKGVEALIKALETLSPNRYTLTLEKYYKKRSGQQNAFYWNNFVPSEIECFKEFWGETYTTDEIHAFNKVNFWGTEKVIEATAEVVRMPESSTINNTVEWEEKLEKARQWFRQNFEWEIGYPNEQEKLNF